MECESAPETISGAGAAAAAGAAGAAAGGGGGLGGSTAAMTNPSKRKGYAIATGGGSALASAPSAASPPARLAALVASSTAGAAAVAAAFPGAEHDDPHDDLRQAAASPRMLPHHHHHYQYSHHRADPVMVGDKVLIGLSVAGFAWALLTSIFGMFHVELFLRAYELPPATYSAGNVVVMAVNTVAHVLGAYVVDRAAAARVVSSSSARSELTGLSGCLFALCFITPFFRWGSSSSNNTADVNGDGATLYLSTGLWDGIHYVVSLSLYYAGFAFSSIVMASVVNDNHHMSDHARVSYMASGKICNLLGSLVVTRIGLALFDPADLFRFRVFLAGLVAFAWTMFAVAQFLISSDREATEDRKDHSSPRLTLGYLLCPRSRPYARRTSSSAAYDPLPPSHHLASPAHRGSGGFGTSSTTTIGGPQSPVPAHGDSDYQHHRQELLHWRQVARDFWRHGNFRSWIGMELLLEAQTTFTSFFLKTFVDGLLLDAVLDRTSCDWLLAMVRPSTEVVSVLIMYLPIRKYGYKDVYLQLFYWNALLSSALLYVIHSSTAEIASSNSTHQFVSLFLLVYPVLTGAVQSAGFHLAQADMVLEMKRNHALEGRYDEPSLAALFMGANALFCRPAESILPITAANVLDGLPGDGETNSALAYRERLLYLLVVPPLVCSVLQIVAWRGYDLTPYRTSRLRDELKKLRASRRPPPPALHGASIEVI